MQKKQRNNQICKMLTIMNQDTGYLEFFVVFFHFLHIFEIFQNKKIGGKQTKTNSNLYKGLEE